MKPHFLENDIKLFYKYLDKSSVYFEFGSGGSTYQSSNRENIKKIYTVESDKSWYRKLKDMIRMDKIHFIYNEMDTQPNNWGYPGPNSTIEQKKNYSEHIRNIKDVKDIDLILIDGRFRVACCLKCFDVIKDDCYIVFDDFLNRPSYHVVLNYYDIIQRGDIMVILKKKTNITVPSELIQKYELKNWMDKI